MVPVDESFECPRVCADGECFCEQQRDLALDDFLAALKPLRAAVLDAMQAELPLDWRVRWMRHQAAVGIQLDVPSMTLFGHYLDAMPGNCHTFGGPLVALAPHDLARDLMEAVGPLLTQLLNSLPRSAREQLALAMELGATELTLSAYEGCGGCFVDVHARSMQAPVHVARVFVPDPFFGTSQ